MKIQAAALKAAIIEVIPGVSDEEANEVLLRAKEWADKRKSIDQENGSLETFLDTWTDVTDARDLIAKADAMQDSDVLMFRQLSEHDRARVLRIAEGLPNWVPWDGARSKDLLILPPKQTTEIRAIPISALKDTAHPFARLGPWFARTAFRISIAYRIRPENAFGFILLDSYFSLSSIIGLKIEQFGPGPRESVIHLEVYPDATEVEVSTTLNILRVHLGLNRKALTRRDLRQKTTALSMVLAHFLSEGKCLASSVDWVTLLGFWNEICLKGERQAWMYVSSESLTNPVHQFARDAKHAIAAVRQSPTPYPILGISKRKPRS